MSNRRRALWSGAALALVMSLMSGAALAEETLADAIALAYETNPTLQAQRANQRALDETYVQARAAYRPTADQTRVQPWMVGRRS